MRTETLEGEPGSAKGPGHWNKFKKQIHARIPKPGRTPSFITPEWLIYKMGTDKISAQAARSWVGALISSVMWDPKEQHFSSGSSRAGVAGWINANVKPVRWNSWSHTEGVWWKTKVKIWGNWVPARLKWSQKWAEDELLKARSYALPWAIQEPKYAKSMCCILGVLHMVLLLKKKVNLKCVIDELVWWKSMKNCWERNRMVC